MKQESATKRTRNFATCIYADSAPENFRDIIDEWHVPCLLSPYHDRDVNADGSPKKPHWHLLLMFDNVKTPEQAIELFQTVNGVGCEIVKSVRAYARYLCHLDNPDKARYFENDVKSYGGADFYELIQCCSDQVAAVAAIQDIIVSERIFSYRQLCDLLKDTYPDLFRVLVLGHTIHITAFLKAFYWEAQQEEAHGVKI